MSKESVTVRPFEPKPGIEYMTISNHLFDYVMPNVSPTAWKVLCFIIRKTTGWHQESDELSLSLIRDGTAIKSHNTIEQAIRNLEEQGYITVTRRPEQRKPSTIALNIDFELEITTSKNDIETASDNDIEKKTMPENDNVTTSKNDIGTGSTMSKIDMTKRNMKDTKKKHVRKSKKPPTPKQQVFLTISQLCHIDLSTATDKQKGQIKSTGDALADKITPKVDDFKVNFEKYWYSHDWRGKQDQAPTPSLIREVYGDFTHWLETGGSRTNGRNPTSTNRAGSQTARVSPADTAGQVAGSRDPPKPGRKGILAGTGKR